MDLQTAISDTIQDYLGVSDPEAIADATDAIVRRVMNCPVCHTPIDKARAPGSMTNQTLMGRGLALMRQFTDDLSRSFGGPPMAEKRRKRLNRNRMGKLTRNGAGGAFEVMLVDEDGRDTGYIAHVSVTYSRFDIDAANAR